MAPPIFAPSCVCLRVSLPGWQIFTTPDAHPCRLLKFFGDHATHRSQYDAPLTADITGFAHPVSSWVHTCASAGTAGADTARAVQAARAAPGGTATFILPADAAWNEAYDIAGPLPVAQTTAVSEDVIARVADLLRSTRRTVLLLRGEALQRHGLEAAGRIAARGSRVSSAYPISGSKW